MDPQEDEYDDNLSVSRSGLMRDPPSDPDGDGLFLNKASKRRLQQNDAPDVEQRLGQDGRTYQTVSANEDDAENDDDEDLEDAVLFEDPPEEVLSLLAQWNQRLHLNLVPDDTLTIVMIPRFGAIRLVENPSVVKALKFVFLTIIGIAVVFHIVRWMGWENDPNLTLSKMTIYEGNLIVMDSLVFFAVARLHRTIGIDHGMFWLWVAGANFYSSYITSFSFLQHSLTLYEMHCTWPWSLWIFATLATIVVTGVLLRHVHYSVETQQFFTKLFELSLAAAIFLWPLLQSPYFHFHHWFAGWLVGMHCNFHSEWWSRAVLAWCWGCYINGIAVYGRDPVLTCDYGFYVSSSQHCPYLKCYTEGIHKIVNNRTNETAVHPMVAPDWRNCSASTYHARW